MRRAEKARVKLGGSPSLAGEFPARPKGMSQRVYERLRAEDEEARDKFFGRRGRGRRNTK
jgi:hypothetical protein